MAKVPGQRKPGQYGGGGRINQSSNRGLSSSRGGRPHAGGGGRKPSSDGCAVVAIALLGALATAGAGVAYGLYAGLSVLL